MMAVAVDIEGLLKDYVGLDVGEDKQDVHLVLSGSGLKLYAFLIAIYVLHLLGYRFVKGTGTSGGAIVIAAIASRYDPESSREERGRALREGIKLALAFDIPALLDPQWFFWRIAFSLAGAIKGNKILKELKKQLPPTFEDLKMPCEIVVFQVNMRDPRTRLLTSGDLPTAVRASMSIPFLFSPVRLDKMLLVDGGWQMNLALPEGGEGVLGMSFGQGENQIREEVPNNLALGFKLIDGAMDEGMRRAVDAAPKADVVTLFTGIGGLDFFLSDEQKATSMKEGADSVLQWARRVKR